MAPVGHFPFFTAKPSKLSNSTVWRCLWVSISLLTLSACQTTPTQTAPTQTAPTQNAPTPSQPANTNSNRALVINIDLTQEQTADEIASSKTPIQVDHQRVDSQDSVNQAPIVITIEQPTATSEPQVADTAVSSQPLAIEIAQQPAQATPPANDPQVTKAQREAERQAAQQQLLARQLQLLDLADRMYLKGYVDLSLSLLDDIIMDALDVTAQGRYLELMAASHLRAGDSYAALAWLHQAQAQAPATDKDSYLHRLQLLQQAYTANEQHLEAAISAIDISISAADVQTTEQHQRRNDIIWNLLLQVPSMQLHAKLQSPIHPIAKGWLELALSTDNLHTLDQQQQAIINWQLNNPLHPASQTPPTSLSKLADLQANQAQKLALLLPTSGPLGKLGQAIIDGFMASYYQTYQACSSDCQPPPQLVFINSHGITDWHTTYQQLNRQGVELVIGPLAKDQVAKLQQIDLPILTLALNYLTDEPANHAADSQLFSDAILQHVSPATSDKTEASATAKPHQNKGELLYQFGLSLEEEAKQLAQHGRQKGYKNALIIHAQTDWAERANRAFQQHWQAFGGQVSDAISFNGNGDHAQSISTGLHIDASKQRRKSLQKLLGQNVKFEPRRRQDVDLVVILALPEDARQLVPTLAFHHAAEIPVFASHHAYQGPTQSTRDRDLNKVYFSDLPWMLEADDTVAAVQHVWPNRQRYNRLFALGADAFRLFPRLEQMQMFPATRVRGLTGLLRLDDQAIKAKLSWARFRKGQPQVQQGAHEIE